MRRSFSTLALLAVAGCGQPAHLHLRRGWEHLHTPSTARIDKAGEAHATAAAAQPPPSCDDTLVKSYNHQVCCRDVKKVVAPQNVDELKALVSGSTGPLRVVGNSHTSNEQICTTGVAISMANFATIHGLRRHDGVEYVVVDPGVRMSELTRWLDAHGRSLGYTVIGFRGISIGGGVATGVHGSSLKNPSVLSSRVEWIEIMDAKGNVSDHYRPKPPQAQMVRLPAKKGQLPSSAPTIAVQNAVMTPPPPSSRMQPPPRRDRDETVGEDAEVDADYFRALSASVGMLGIVTKIGLRVEPRFNLDVTVDFHQARVLWTDGPEKLIGKCDWGQLVWLPRASRVMRVCGMRTLSPVDAGAQNTLLAPYMQAGSIAAFKELMEDTIANGAYLCTIETERYDQLKWYPPFLRDCCCKTKYTTHAIGPSDLMMSSELTEHQSELAEIDYEIALPLDRVPAALEYMLHYARGDARLCMPLIGAFLRFSPVDDSTLIAHSVTDDGWFKGQKVMFLEFVVYVLHEPESDEERQKQESDYYAKYRQLAIDLVEKFHGRPHWAKNQVPVFQVHKEEDKLYQARLKEFHCFVRQNDPDGRFSNEFTDTVGLTAPRSTHATEEKVEDCVKAAKRQAATIAAPGR